MLHRKVTVKVYRKEVSLKLYKRSHSCAPAEAYDNRMCRAECPSSPLAGQDRHAAPFARAGAEVSEYKRQMCYADWRRVNAWRIWLDLDHEGGRPQASLV